MNAGAGINQVWMMVLIVGLLGGISCTAQKEAVFSKEERPLLTPGAVISVASAPATATGATVQAAYGKLPLHFETNQGQSDEEVKFLARGNGYTLFLTATEAVLSLTQQSASSSQQAAAQISDPRLGTLDSRLTLRMQLVGANPQPQVTGLDELPGKSNYFFGNAPAQWHTNIPTYGKVKYENVYPGIALIYYGNQQHLEYDFVVAPGADPTVIRLAFDGLIGAGFKSAPTIDDATGDLVLTTASGELRFHQPRIYQDIDGTKKPIAGRYILFDSETVDSGLRTLQVGFEVAAYDTSKPLVIDPVLVYSTYLGGSSDDAVNAIAVDVSGNVYVAGGVGSVDFPVASESSQTRWGQAFVAKFAPTGSALIYATYLGRSPAQAIKDLVIDAQGNAYVAGITASDDFPTTTSAFQPTSSCRREPDEVCPEAFVAKLNSQGSALLYSTYLSGSKGSNVSALATDTTGNMYVTGSTWSDDFPVTPGAFQSVCHLIHDDAHVCGDSFITKLNSTGSALVYSTYFGGDKNFDQSLGIAVDPLGHAYVTGYTWSDDLPTTPGSLQSVCVPDAFFGCFDAFAVKFNPAGSALVYSTYLGGNQQDSTTGIKVDTSGNAYLTGWTASGNFPTTTQSFQAEPCPGCGSFLAKLDPSGSEFVYSTYLLGFEATGLDIDNVGNAYVAGGLLSFTPDKVCYGGFGQFPVPCPITTALVTKVNETGSALVYTTLLGGGRVNSFRSDSISDIAVDSAGNAYVTGQTNSADFPITVGAFQNTLSGSSDAFIAKIADRPAGIMAFFESPENGPVSGISVIRGWAFAAESGVQISSVELFIDGQSAGEVPCCSSRGDVQTAFPQFPADNTLNSGWGTVFNWGLASTGYHGIRLFIRSTSGELFVTDTRTVAVVKPGDFEYLDQFDLSQATVSIQGNDLIVNSVIVRDKVTQQQKQINVRFRWFESSQSFGVVVAETLAAVSSLRSWLSPLFASLSAQFGEITTVAHAQTGPSTQAFFEEPEASQEVSGIGVMRGWAFDETRLSLPPVLLAIDGQASGTIPCCSTRADVAAVFPGTPNALYSGWGTVLNYNLLSSGQHSITVGLGYAGYNFTIGQHTVTVVKPGGFEFLDQFDLSQTAAQIVQVHPWSQPDKAEIRLTGVQVRGKATQQIKVIDVHLRWFENAQGLGISAASN